MMDLGVVRDSKPILISGVYRSGTTFLAALLGAHPEIRASSSTIKFLRFCAGRYGDLSIRGNRKNLIEDSLKRVETRWRLTFDAEKVLSDLDASTNVSYALTYDLLMRDMLCRDEPQNIRWAEKLAVQWSDIPTFLELFPAGRVVHIIRDPRDVTTSYKLMTFEKGNTYLDAAFNCRHSMESLYHLDVKYKDKVKLIKAEDLAKTPRIQVHDLCDFLNVSYSESMLQLDKLHTEGEDWSSNTSHGKRVTQWPDAKPRWPVHLSRVETLFIEMITQPYLTKFGYDSSGFVPSVDEWISMYQLMDDEFLKKRFTDWLRLGKGAEGYRTDPYMHEMKIVFPERFKEAKLRSSS